MRYDAATIVEFLTRLGGRIFVAMSSVLRHRWARPAVRALTNAHARLYRLTRGRAAVPRFPTLLLTVTGRRTGEPRTVPLVYVRDGDAYVVCAAYSGSAKDPAWWLNLRANPEAMIQVGSRQGHVRANLAPSERRADLWLRLTEMYPPFRTYSGRTDRPFPIVLLQPIEKGSALTPVPSGEG